MKAFETKNYCKNWYAIFVLTGKEDNVKERLNYNFGDNISFIVPKRRLKERRNGEWKEITRPFFPGYVLANGDIDKTQYFQFSKIPELVKLLCSDSEPLRIELNEIDYILALIDKDGFIGYSDILINNNRVIVTDGPLTSMQGNIVSINKRKGRARVRINFLGNERVVDLGIRMLEII